MTSIYIHFQDLVDAYVGPFEDASDVDEKVAAHVAFCQKRGDGSAFLGIVSELPADAFVISVADDLAFTND